MFKKKKRKESYNYLEVLEHILSKRYPVETIINVDYAENLVLLANTPARAESLLHSLEQAGKRYWSLSELR